jgi:hypothetical protein
MKGAVGYRLQQPTAKGKMWPVGKPATFRPTHSSCKAGAKLRYYAEFAGTVKLFPFLAN